MRNDQRYALANRFVTDEEARIVRERALRRRDPVNILDPVVDERWARLMQDTKAPKSYFDYYFSGQDVRIYVAEIGDDPDFGNLPLIHMAFNVEQQKTPVYGFWSYTYDAVLRGNRIVAGQFAIATRYPNYMRDLLAKAANNRASNHTRLADSYPTSRGLTENDRNIDQYWGKHLDHAAIAAGQTEWSIHPPFSFIVVYGIQNTSMTVDDPGKMYNSYDGDTALFFDRNERLVERQDFNVPTRIVLDACELQSVSREYVPDGTVLVETYTFFARDIVVPPPGFSRGGHRPASGPM